MIDLLCTWICMIGVVTLLLILVSVTMRAFKGVLDNLIARLSSCWIHDLKCWSLHLLNKWKEKQLEKMFMILLPKENLGLSGSNEGKTLLKQLSMSTK